MRDPRRLNPRRVALLRGVIVVACCLCPARYALAQARTADSGLASPSETLRSANPTLPATGLDDVVSAVDDSGPMTNAGGIPGPPASMEGARVQQGLLGIVGASLIGNLEARTDLWRPLPLRTFFSEGWLEPWRHQPLSSGGAPRQPWINSQDGTFFRAFFTNFTDFNEFHRNGNAYAGTYVFFAPISRRLQVRFDVPFILSGKGAPNNDYHDAFGDFIVTPRFLLSETRDLSQIFSLAIRTPTGRANNGNNLTTLTPHYEFWYGGLPRGWVIRGSTGVTVRTATEKTRDTYDYNLAVGKYWTPYDGTLFSDFLTYVSMNGFSTLEGPGAEYTFASVTPGFRFHLQNKWYLLGGVDVPLTGPKRLNFTWAPIVVVVKSF